MGGGQIRDLGVFFAIVGANRAIAYCGRASACEHIRASCGARARPTVMHGRLATEGDEMTRPRLTQSAFPV